MTKTFGMLINDGQLLPYPKLVTKKKTITSFCCYRHLILFYQQNFVFGNLPFLKEVPEGRRVKKFISFPRTQFAAFLLRRVVFAFQHR